MIDTIYDSMGKQLVEVPRTELTSILGIQDVPLASSFKAEGVPEQCLVKIEGDPDEVEHELENAQSSKTSENYEFLDYHEEKLAERRRGRRSTKRQCYKEVCDDDDAELEESMQDIFEAAKSEMSHAEGDYDPNEEWQPEFHDMNEAEVFTSGDKEDVKKFKEEVTHGEEPLKSTAPLNRKWQPKEYKHIQYARYGQIRIPNNLRKRGRPRTKSPDDEDDDVKQVKKPRRSKAKKSQHLKNESGEESNDDDDFIPDVKREQVSSDEGETTNTSYQVKATKPTTGIRDIVSGCKPIKIDVRSAGGDFHIIPADAARKIKPDGSKSNRSKIDFTYKQYMVKPSFAAVVGVARTGDPSDTEGLVGRPLAWSYPSGEEEMNSQYNAVTEAYRHVFGFSEEDVHCNKTFIIAHFGSYKDVPHEYKDPKREIGIGLYRRYKKMDPAALKCELEQRKEKQPAYERKEKLPTLTLQGKKCQLKFDPTLEPKNFEGIMLIAWHINKIRPSDSSYRKAIGKVLNFDVDVAQNKRHYNTMWEQPSKVLELFMRVLRDVWMNGTTWLPLSQNMFSMFKTVFERACAPRLLGNLMVGNVPEHMCSECGKTFTVMSSTEYSLYKGHMKKHAIEKSFRLDCGCTNVGKVRSTKARDRHMKLHHSGGKYVKCRKCVEVIEKDNLKDHIAKNHVESERCCEVCGKSCPHK